MENHLQQRTQFDQDLQQYVNILEENTQLAKNALENIKMQEQKEQIILQSQLLKRLNLADFVLKRAQNNLIAYEQRHRQFPGNDHLLIEQRINEKQINEKQNIILQNKQVISQILNQLRKLHQPLKEDHLTSLKRKKENAHKTYNKMLFWEKRAQNLIYGHLLRMVEMLD